MNADLRIRIALLAALAGPMAPGLAAADWPRSRGPAGDGHAPPGEAVPATLPAAPKELWRVSVAEGMGSPAVAGGKVFHLDARDGRETVHALDAATGNKIWSVALDELFKDNQGAPCPRTTPLVDGDRVYVQSCRGEFQCLAVADGRKIWGVNFQRDFGAPFLGEVGQSAGASRHGNTGSPVLDGGRIFVNVGGTNGASVVCFDKLNGQVLWKSQNDLAAYADLTLGAIAGVKQIVDFTVEAVIGLDANDGSLLWRVPVKTGFGRHITAPGLMGDLVLASSYQAGLLAIRAGKEGAGWQAGVAWTNKECAINMSGFVLVDGHLYGLGAGRKLICVDAKSGAKKWAARDALTGPMAKDLASFTVLDGKILVLTYDGQLLLVAADPAACRVLSSIQLCDKTWSAPACSNGKLFFRDVQTLRCVQLL